MYYLSPISNLSKKRIIFLSKKTKKKRRAVLNQLFYEDWNYNTSGNTYYGYNFLNKDILDYIMDEVPLHLSRYKIAMEDPSLVSLNLSIAIMYHRVVSGHPLPSTPPIPKPDTQPILLQIVLLMR